MAKGFMRMIAALVGLFAHSKPATKVQVVNNSPNVKKITIPVRKMPLADPAPEIVQSDNRVGTFHRVLNQRQKRIRGRRSNGYSFKK